MTGGLCAPLALQAVYLLDDSALLDLDLRQLREQRRLSSAMSAHCHAY